MKTKRIYKQAYVLVGAMCYLVGALLLQSYGNMVNHPIINDLIVDQFTIDKANIAKYNNYTFVFDGMSLEGNAVTNPGLVYRSYGEASRTMSPREWIKHGGLSADEPEVQASVRHFYDPTAPAGEHYLRNVAWGPIMALAQESYPNPKIDQLEWALVGDNMMTEDDPLNHQYTWEHAKKWMKAAWEEPNEASRARLMAKAWRALGETLHMIADFGHPAHVRDDSHPAPLGYTAFFGDGDPYEEIMAAKFAVDDKASFPFGTPDAGTVSSVKGLYTVRDIAKVLAAWTNKYFFTNETIMGDIDGKHVYHIAHPQRELPQPRLQDMDYNGATQTFVATIGGQHVDMCRDASMIWSRSYPYVDEHCVLSQARLLIPTIIAVGSRVTDLFIPTLSVELNTNNPSRITGTVKHTPDAEYGTAIVYAGPVRMEVYDKAGKFKSAYSVSAVQGSFSFTSLQSADGDRVRAVVNAGGVYVNSPFYTVSSTTTKSLLNLDNFIIRGDFVWKSEYALGNVVREQFSDWTLSASNATITAGSISLNKATAFLPHSVSSFTAHYNTTTQRIDSFRIVASLPDNGSGRKSTYILSLKSAAPVSTWYQTNGADIMTIGFNQFAALVNYTENRYVLKVDDKGNAYWALEVTLTENDLKASDGAGHNTSIRFSSTSVH